MLKFSEFIALDYNEDNDTHYLFDLENGRMFKLNETAQKLLNCINKTGSYKEYVLEVVNQTSAPSEVVEQDIKMYLKDLIDKGYVFELSTNHE